MASGRPNTRPSSRLRNTPLLSTITCRPLLSTRSTRRKIRILQALLMLSTKTYTLHSRPIPLTLLRHLTFLATKPPVHTRMPLLRPRHMGTPNFTRHSPSRLRTLSSDARSHSDSLRVMPPSTTPGYTTRTASHHSTLRREDRRRLFSRRMGDLSR